MDPILSSSFFWCRQISNPCESRSSLVCFVSQGRMKHIHENTPKNAIEPSPKFDGHLSKSANRVSSLLSYRAFELTQVNTVSLSLTCCGIKVVVQVVFFCGFCKIQCVSLVVFSAIFFRVCIRWDQGPAQARMSIRCGCLPVQRQGGCSKSDCTQARIPAGNGETLQVFQDVYKLHGVLCL